MDGHVVENGAPGSPWRDSTGAGDTSVPGEAVRLCLVPAEHVGLVLEQVAQWVEGALMRAPEIVAPMSEVRAKLEAGDYRLMLAGVNDRVHACVVFEVREMRESDWLFVVAAGGVQGGSLALVGNAMWRGVVELARELGVRGVRMVARPGWTRWCARQGVRVRVRVRQVLLEVGV